LAQGFCLRGQRLVRARQCLDGPAPAQRLRSWFLVCRHHDEVADPQTLGRQWLPRNARCAEKIVGDLAALASAGRGSKVEAMASTAAQTAVRLCLLRHGSRFKHL